TGSAVMADAEWTAMMAQAEHEMANGAHYVAMSVGIMSETAVMRYTRAAFLLAWNGVDGSAYTYNCDENADCHNANWTIEIGAPTESRSQIGVGWIRHYSDGVVVENPS